MRRASLADVSKEKTCMSSASERPHQHAIKTRIRGGRDGDCEDGNSGTYLCLCDRRKQQHEGPCDGFMCVSVSVSRLPSEPRFVLWGVGAYFMTARR